MSTWWSDAQHIIAITQVARGGPGQGLCGYAQQPVLKEPHSTRPGYLLALPAQHGWEESWLEKLEPAKPDFRVKSGVLRSAVGVRRPNVLCRQGYRGHCGRCGMPRAVVAT